MTAYAFTEGGAIAAPPFDPVKKPEHYANKKTEVIDYIRERGGDGDFIGYCKGNAIKYLSRAGWKTDEAEDYAKAAWYAQMAAHVMKPGKYRDPREGR